MTTSYRPFAGHRAVTKPGRLFEATKDNSYNPRTDDEVYLGTALLDQIEQGVIGTVDWFKDASKDQEGIGDDILRLLGGGLINTATAISHIPGIKQLGELEDWIAEQARALNEQATPWLDPRFAGWGSRIATGIVTDKGIGLAGKGVRAGYNALGKSLMNTIDDFTGLYGGVGTAMDVSGGTVDTIRRWPDGTVAQNPFLRLYKREDAARIGQGLQDAVPARPSAATIWDKKMDDIYKLLTGRDPDLPTAGAEKLQGIPLGGRAPGPKFIKHHPAPLAHIARSLDYLTDAAVVEGAEYLANRIGFKLGDFQPGTLAPDKFHSKMHRFLDDSLGTNKSGVLSKLEKKYAKKFVKLGGGKKLSEGVSLQVRIDSGFMDELADVLIEQKGFIDDWYRALVNRAEFKKVSIEEYVNEASETVKADKVLKAVLAGKTTKGKGISDLLDELIGLENKELRDTMKDLQQLSGREDLLLSPANRNLRKSLTFKAKKEFLNEVMNMDWAGTSIADARKKVLKLVDDYDLPFETDKFTPEQLADEIVESLHNLNIDESLNPVIAKEIKDWLGRE